MIAAMIILFDLVFFGIELAAVLAKVTAFVPATYSRLLAFQEHSEAIDTAEALTRKIQRN